MNSRLLKRQDVRRMSFPKTNREKQAGGFLTIAFVTQTVKQMRKFQL